MAHRAVSYLAVPILAGLACLAAGAARADGPPILVNYGKHAPAREGDNDHRQVIYFSVPATTAGPLYLRVFDPDADGEFDLRYGGPGDTSTRFAVFGGAGADASAAAEPEQVSEAEMTAGTLVADRTFDVNSGTDGQWATVAVLDPARGERVGDRVVFRLLVDAVTGDDANVFDVALSLDESENRPPAGLKVYSYSATIRLPSRDKTTELRFFIPEDAEELVVGNFDAAWGTVFLTTKFASYPLTASGQNKWSETHFTVDPELRGRHAAITLTGGREFPNDATFYVADGKGRLIPFEVPPRLIDFDARPTAFAEAYDTDSCTAIGLNATQSSDPEGDTLSYLWKFGDGRSRAGDNVVHNYTKDGHYTARLEVVDSFDQIGNGSVATVEVFAKKPPVARSEVKKLVSVDEFVLFDGKPSTAGDWSVARHEWQFGDGAVNVGAEVAHAYHDPGVYKVVHTIEDDSGHRCNTASEEFEIRVNERPVAKAGADQRVSIGQTTTFDAEASRDGDGSLTAYHWYFGDGEQGTGKTVEHAYARPGTYEVRLVVEDDASVANSSGADSLTVIVNDPPVAEAGPDRSVAIGEPITFDGFASRDSDGSIIRYAWDFGDGEAGNGGVREHAYRRPGTYEVKLTVTDDSTTDSATRSDTLKVRVNNPPTAAAGPDQLVTASVVHFDGSKSADTDDRVAYYTWDFGDGSIGVGEKTEHVYARPGAYDVTLTVADDSKTIRNTASDVMHVVVNQRPIADAGPDLIGAPGETLVFQGGRSVDPDGTIAEYLWDFRDGSTGSGKTVGHAFPKPGIYAVRLRVKDNTRQDEAVDYAETRVVVNEQPVADAGRDLIAAPGDPVRLSAAGSFDPDGTIEDYRWDFSDRDEPMSGTEVTRTFDEPGVYTAQLTVTDDSGTANAIATDEIRVLINHRPVAAAGSDVNTSSVTVGFDAGGSVDADGDALTYAWDFGDGTGATGLNVTHTYAEGGTYPVVLTVDDGTGLKNATAEDAISVVVNRAPTAVAGENRRVCTGDPVVLDGSGSSDPEGGILKYRWDFGDGTSADIVNPTKAYTRGAVYPVTLTVTDDSGFPGNMSVARLAVQVDQGPIANAGADILACANSEVRFDGSASTDIDGVVNSFTWDFGDGQTGGGERPAHFYTKPGDYRVFLTIEGEEAGICDSTSHDEVAVRIVEGPTATISAPGDVPVNVVASFDGSASYMTGGSISNWRWDFGDGTTAEGPTAEHAFAKAGVYRVALTLESEQALPTCRQVSAYHLIRVNAAPIAEAGADKLVAVDEETVFDASASSDPDGGIVAYDWDFGDGATASGIEARHRYRAPGTYTVKLIVHDESDLANSATTDTMTVTVNRTPTPAIVGPAVACVGSPETWRAEGGPGSDFAWTLGDGDTASGATASHAYSKPGRYDLVLDEDDKRGLANSHGHATGVVHVNQPPLAVAGADRLVCPGDTVRFDGSDSGDLDGALTRHAWDFGDGTTAEGAKVEHVFRTPGTYTVRLTVTDDAGSACSSAEDSLDVVVNSPPVANAGGSRAVWIGGAADAVLLDGSQSMDPDGEALDFDWRIGTATELYGERVRQTFTEPGEVPVRLIVSDTSGLACGTATDTISIKARRRD